MRNVMVAKVTIKYREFVSEVQRLCTCHFAKACQCIISWACYARRRFAVDPQDATTLRKGGPTN